MNYTIELKNNYVSGIVADENGQYTDEQIRRIFDNFQHRMNFYYKDGNSFVLDTELEERTLEEEAKQKEIEELKLKLNGSDYIWNVIKEGDRDESYYAEIIEQRHAWRLRVRELEEQ